MGMGCECPERGRSVLARVYPELCTWVQISVEAALTGLKAAGHEACALGSQSSPELSRAAGPCCPGLQPLPALPFGCAAVSQAQGTEERRKQASLSMDLVWGLFHSQTDNSVQGGMAFEGTLQRCLL